MGGGRRSYRGEVIQDGLRQVRSAAARLVAVILRYRHQVVLLLSGSKPEIPNDLGQQALPVHVAPEPIERPARQRRPRSCLCSSLVYSRINVAAGIASVLILSNSLSHCLRDYDSEGVKVPLELQCAFSMLRSDTA